MPRISIVLPTYNEAGNIELLIDRTLQALGSYPGGVEVVVVDDDSPDKTWQLVARKAAQDRRVRLIHRRGESGLTSAISRGIHEALGEWVGWMDCDMSMPPEQWPQLADTLAGGGRSGHRLPLCTGGWGRGPLLYRPPLFPDHQPLGRPTPELVDQRLYQRLYFGPPRGL